MSEWAPFVPLFQTVLWVLLIVVAIVIFRKKLHDLFDAAKKRVEEGSSFEAGPVKIGPRPELQKLPYAAPGEDAAPAVKESVAVASVRDDLAGARDTIYQRNRHVFLVHELAPSSVRNQRYDIFIYLAAHLEKGEVALRQVTHAKFFLGRHFGNKVVIGSKIDGVLGMRTSSYGEFLVVCEVTFEDGKTVILDRYIDFAMGDRADAVARTTR